MNYMHEYNVSHGLNFQFRNFEPHIYFDVFSQYSYNFYMDSSSEAPNSPHDYYYTCNIISPPQFGYSLAMNNGGCHNLDYVDNLCATLTLVFCILLLLRTLPKLSIKTSC